LDSNWAELIKICKIELDKISTDTGIRIFPRSYGVWIESGDFESVQRALDEIQSILKEAIAKKKSTTDFSRHNGHTSVDTEPSNGVGRSQPTDSSSARTSVRRRSSSADTRSSPRNIADAPREPLWGSPREVLEASRGDPRAGISHEILDASRDPQGQVTSKSFDQTNGKRSPQGVTGSGTRILQDDVWGTNGRLEIFTTPLEGIKVEIVEGNLIREQTEAIVNPTDKYLSEFGAAARCIASAAGSSLKTECSEYRGTHGQLGTSKVMHTSAGHLPKPIRYIIHAVGPSSSDTLGLKRCDLLEDTFFNCLLYANDELKLSSVSVPAIGAGEA